MPEAETLSRYNDDYFVNEYLPSLGITDSNYDLNFFDERYATVLSLIRESAEISDNGKLLEIGFGAGFFLKSAERAGWDVTGTEASQPCHQYAKDELSLNVELVKAEEIDFAAGSFDVAVMFDVIEHLSEPLRVLQLVNRSLKDGGLLVIATPNYDAASRIMLGNEWSIFSPVDHLYYFTELSLINLLKKAGFAGNILRTVPHGGVYETMNPRNTHFPNSYRAKLYSSLVNIFGKGLHKTVQRRGWSDLLFCLAYAQKETALTREISEPLLEVTSPR